MVLQSSTARTGSPYGPGLRGCDVRAGRFGYVRRSCALGERCASAAQVPISAAGDGSRSFAPAACGSKFKHRALKPKAFPRRRATGTPRADYDDGGGLPRSRITLAWRVCGEANAPKSSMMMSADFVAPELSNRSTA